MAAMAVHVLHNFQNVKFMFDVTHTSTVFITQGRHKVNGIK